MFLGLTIRLLYSRKLWERPCSADTIFRGRRSYWHRSRRLSGCQRSAKPKKMAQVIAQSKHGSQNGIGGKLGLSGRTRISRLKAGSPY